MLIHTFRNANRDEIAPNKIYFVKNAEKVVDERKKKSNVGFFLLFIFDNINVLRIYIGFQ